MVEYQLELRIYDTERKDGATYDPVYRDKAELEVTSLRSIGDRTAFDTLVAILRAALVPEGSTVEERRAISEARRPLMDVLRPISLDGTVEPEDVAHFNRKMYDGAGVADLDDPSHE